MLHWKITKKKILRKQLIENLISHLVVSLIIDIRLFLTIVRAFLSNRIGHTAIILLIWQIYFYLIELNILQSSFSSDRWTFFGAPANPKFKHHPMDGVGQPELLRSRRGGLVPRHHVWDELSLTGSVCSHRLLSMETEHVETGKTCVYLRSQCITLGWKSSPKNDWT